MRSRSTVAISRTLMLYVAMRIERFAPRIASTTA
jgi:hypothetical protein